MSCWKALLIPCMFLMMFQLRAENDCKVLSLSSAILDHLVLVSDETLATITNKKGSWAQVELSDIREILSKTELPPHIMPGGSGVNVMKGLTCLGEKCAVVGRVGSDAKGAYYIEKMHELGITLHLTSGELATGQVLCLITPDGQRTFRSYLGASHDIDDFQLDPALFANIKLFHVEGYQLIDEKLIKKAMQLAKAAGCKISLDLANVDLVREHKNTILLLLAQNVDILFCNESEALELTNLPAEEACSALATFCDIAVVTMSERGSYAQQGEMQVFTPANKVRALDSTGAGDLFASGFLHGLINNKSLSECGWLGSLVASHVVQVIGAEIPRNSWEQIEKAISKRNAQLPEAA